MASVLLERIISSCNCITIIKDSKIIINLGVTASAFTNEDLNNAMWNSLTEQIYIGDRNVKSLSASLDVLAHEFTHGVVQFTANFDTVAKRR